jgi:hypothetical protein
LAFSDKINDADIMPVIGVPEPIASGDSGDSGGSNPGGGNTGGGNTGGGNTGGSNPGGNTDDGGGNTDDGGSTDDGNQQPPAPTPIYGISLNAHGNYPFSATIVEGGGYTVPAALTVTITNTGNQPTGNLTLALNSYLHFEIASANGSYASSSINIGSITTYGTFKVRPKTPDARIDPYTATVTVSGNNGISAYFNVSFTVKAASGISLNPNGTYSFPAANVGYGTQTAKSVTVTNTLSQPTGPLSINLSDNTAFTLSHTSIVGIAPAVGGGGSTYFTVTPKTGLAAGIYAATVEVTDGIDISAEFAVSFTVNPAPTYGISLNPSGTYNFPAATAGYGAQTAKSVTVSNTGNQATGNLMLALSSSSAFTLSATSMGSIAAGGSNSFTVTPKTGLDPGTYTATVTVNGGNSISASFNVSFTVNKASDYSIALYEAGTSELNSTTNPLIFPAVAKYYPQPPGKTVTVINIGDQATGQLMIGLAGDSPSSFVLNKTSITNIAAGSSTTFTVTPITGIPARAAPYTAIVTVSGDNIASKSFTVSFSVETYGISLKDDTTVLNDKTLTFDWRVRGYTAEQTGLRTGAPAPKTIAISNTGTHPTGGLTVELSGTRFALGDNTPVPSSEQAFTVTPSPSSTIGSIAASGNDFFTIKPNPGLDDGTYTATVTVSNNLTGIQRISEEFNVSFTVYTKKNFTELLSLMATEAGGAASATPYTLPPNDVGETDTYDGSYTLNCPVEVTIHGGGRVITGNNNGTGIVVGAGRSLTVTNLTLKKLKFTVQQGGSLVLGNGAVLRENSGSGVNVGAGGLLQMENGSLVEANGYSGVLLLAGGTIESHSTFTMNGGTISNNTQSGVRIEGSYSEFTMNGGTISGNSCSMGGGVRIAGVGSKFTMNGGFISSNTTNGFGGGVELHFSNTEFEMKGGEISGNYAGQCGGGVILQAAGSKFTMTGGTIHDNTAEYDGGGVMLNNEVLPITEFNMSGEARIYNNYAKKWGGGVYVGGKGVFTMNGGVIYDNRANNTPTAEYPSAALPPASGGGVFLEAGGRLEGSPKIGGTQPTSGGWIHGNKRDNTTLDDVYPLPAL